MTLSYSQLPALREFPGGLAEAVHHRTLGRLLGAHEGTVYLYSTHCCFQHVQLNTTMFPPRRLPIFVKLEDESSQSFCSAERREVLLVTRPTPTSLLDFRVSLAIDSGVSKIPDRSHLELGCMARRGRDVPTVAVVPSPDAGEHWRVQW